MSSVTSPLPDDPATEVARWPLRTAAHLLGLGLVSAVLIALPVAPSDLDRHQFPKETAVHLATWLAVVLLLFMGFAGAFRGGSGGVTALLFLWFFIGGCVDAVQAARAATNLNQNFREVVALGPAESKATGPVAETITSIH